MRRVALREAAVTHVVEFTFALTFFMLLLQSFATTMDFRLGVDEDRQARLIAQARDAAAQLVASPGNASGDSAWERYAYGRGAVQLRHGFTPGLQAEAEPGVLAAEKSRALARLPYAFLREALGVSDHLRIAVTTLPAGAPVVLWGADPATARLSATEVRLLLLRDGNLTVPARLEVTVFQGPGPARQLRITEVMYAPPDDYPLYEWVEVYNPGTVAVVLDEWYLEDRSGDRDLLVVPENETLTLPARTAGVVAVSTTFFRAQYPALADYPFIFGIDDLALGNGLDDDDNLTFGYRDFRDRVTYSSAAGGQGNGRTLTREGLASRYWDETDPTPGVYEAD